jgi:16S rRNA (adenine1518-N6/adenine1519-N6)-dimethyltransferase
MARRFDGPVRLVSNLPYAISGPALRHILDLRDVLADWSVMVQREVGERLLAPPGNKTYGSLAVLHSLMARAEHLMDLQPGCFFPEPQVRSTFIRLLPLAEPPLALAELPQVERVVRAAFGNRRKTLVNALRGAGTLSPPPTAEALRAVLRDLGIDPRARGETLAPRQFLDLTRALAKTQEQAGAT